MCVDWWSLLFQTSSMVTTVHSVRRLLLILILFLLLLLLLLMLGSVLLSHLFQPTSIRMRLRTFSRCYRERMLMDAFHSTADGMQRLLLLLLLLLLGALR